MSYSLQFMEQCSVVCLGESKTAVTVGVSDRLSPDVVKTLQVFHGKPVQQKVLGPQELRSRIQRAAASRSVATDRPGSGVRSASARRSYVSIDEIAEDAPAVNIVNALLNDAVRSRASDIHLGAHETDVAVRYRIDGRLVRIARLPGDRFAEVSARMKVLAGLNPSERRRPQDGRFSARLGDDTFDLRFSSLPTDGGESLVLRLFRQSREAFTIYDLGLSNSALFEIRSIIRRASGFLLVSGPTGSGKTTTLHACLRHISGDERKIVTIEDPVEYHLPEIDQVQTNPTAGLTFDSILKRVLRQDPNVIMVGEIRDQETAGLAIRAALTGHLVLSTVHARSPADVTDRLGCLGVDAALLKSVAPLIVEQRLVRVRCAECDGRGCGVCSNTGFRGRTGIFGVATMDHGLTSMTGDGLRKVIAGQTTHQEVSWATVG
jgi:general secretion pathway protein E